MDSGPTVPGTSQIKAVARRRRLKSRLVEAALEHYRLRGARLELLRQRSFAEVFRVVSRRGQFVLRVYNLAGSYGEEAPSSGLLRWRRGAGCGSMRGANGELRPHASVCASLSPFGVFSLLLVRVVVFVVHRRHDALERFVVDPLDVVFACPNLIKLAHLLRELHEDFEDLDRVGKGEVVLGDLLIEHLQRLDVDALGQVDYLPFEPR